MIKATKETLETTIDRIQHWDTQWCIRLNGYSAQKQIAIGFKVISRAGDGAFWYLMMLLTLLVEGAAALMPVAITLLISLVGLAIYKSLKQKTVRPRPYQVHQVIVLGERPLDHFSFPSGHTLHAVLFTIMLGVCFNYLLVVLVPFMVLVAISRMVLGLHYPSDVLVGALIGAALALGGLEVYALLAV